MNKIAITNLYKKFGTHVVLNKISLSANKGDIIVLLGSSGSGKSTLLRCINLLEKPDGGMIKIDEFAIDHSANKKIAPKLLVALRTKVGMVFQQFNLWQHLTILENLIAAPMLVLKTPKKLAIAHATEILEKVGISQKMHTYPSQLSGGQQQRAAIARTLMMNPEIILFDEPTSALDPEMTNEVLKVIKSLATLGMTMFIATHEIGFAREIATHVVFLENGNIVEQGVANKILNQPKTDRLKQFLEAVKY